MEPRRIALADRLMTTNKSSFQDEYYKNKEKFKTVTFRLSILYANRNVAQLLG